MTDKESSESLRIPNFELADKAFLLTKSELSDRHPQIIKELIEEITIEKLAPYYYHLTKEYVPNLIKFDEHLYKNLLKSNDEEIFKLNESIKKVEDEDEGQLETAEGYKKLGEYYTKIGDKTKAIQTLKKAIELTPSTGSKIDISLTIVRIGFFYDDKSFVSKQLDFTKSLIDKGGDWERRNRFKTYQGLYYLSIRDFQKSSNLLIDSLATFTSTEITTYEQLAIYATISGAFSLSRNELKEKIIDSPELLSLLPATKNLTPITSLTNSLYTSDYSLYFKYLLETNDVNLIPSRFLSIHSNYFIREMRRKAYAQLLESYKTLSLNSMAQAFGVSIEFLDNDLTKFIPNKKLNCVIDRVNGIIETNRPDNKNSQYQILIKQGDALLTKLQKYGAAVRLTGTTEK
ncbi:26S proteasome non-ATPase regulatory subunit [Wickerhamomyces ciferrii]|uniref:26S proteasome non-ATPase regulatory subunit n=1 Tax=Wickerhamomyces ciferrii (strain ATCC 14091 / BCRC 22168 / CBS 111 / JCM 3599 / NBRC 0793 / NRRL Y-1031 F-60-10) TaxID=1206466 RepID=K0KIJ5_WICCF|nr:26S proteasome non-ATPase regulatory subunit [Wickerhamomyces ciferrii]CCH42796.1 26S proteasome non-ATPase regulatory subunit [Wickerhamomyces ciferrii]